MRVWWMVAKPGGKITHMADLREEFIIIEKGGGRGKEGEKIKRKGRERGKAEVCTAHGEKGSKWGGRRRERFL